jgi:oligoribonuclease NrnB/cAMP/cGMP phosphodiesterase (DHH superfamily)
MIPENYNMILITDISVNEEVAEMLYDIYTKTSKLVLLFDHHKTALWLNDKYSSWATVQVESNDELCCGTQLLFDWLTSYFAWDINSEPYHRINKYVSIVNKYDTWLWQTKYKDDEPKRFNDLFHIMGREDYIKTIINKIDRIQFVDLDSSELMLLHYRQKEIDRYIEIKNQYLTKIYIAGHKVGVVFSEHYTSELGNKLCELNPDIDFVALINPSYAVSFRTIKDIDVGEFAKKHYGGGGHPKSAGMSIGNDVKKELIDLIFKL